MYDGNELVGFELDGVLSFSCGGNKGFVIELEGIVICSGPDVGN